MYFPSENGLRPIPPAHHRLISATLGRALRARLGAIGEILDVAVYDFRGRVEQPASDAQLLVKGETWPAGQLGMLENGDFSVTDLRPDHSSLSLRVPGMGWPSQIAETRARIT